MKERMHAIIFGTVQGVSFREFARRKAESLSVSGWARNKNDGTVEITAEGERAQLDELVAWCHRGPKAAHIDKVDCEFSEPKNEFKTFKIRF